MKIRYFVPVMLIIAAASSGVFARTGTEQTQQKPIAPFTKKSEASVKLAPKPAPIPLPASTGRTSISGKNYLGLEVGLTSSTLYGGNDYAVGAIYPNPLGGNPILVNADLDEYQPQFGFLFNGLVDIAFNETMGLQGKIGYRQHKGSGTGVTPENSLDPALMNDVDFTWDFFGIDALFRYQFAEDGIYGLGGFGFSNLLSNFVQGTQEFDDGSGTVLNFEGEQQDFYNTSRLDFKLGVGTWIPLGSSGVVLTPELIIAVPLTKLHSNETIDDYEALDRETADMLFATVSLGIKFPLGGSSSSSGSYTSTSSSNEQETPEPGKATLRGRVIDNAGEPIDDATVTVVDLNTNEVVATDETDDGIYNVKVNAPGRYSVTADAPGYLFGSAYFEVDKDGRILRHSGDIKLSPSTDGRVRLLIFFDFDKATLQSSSYPELNRAVALMKANPSMEVEIAGYTDAQGTDAYNKDLSQRRANTVREYLVRQGVEGSRVTAMGYGEANPVATNDTEDGRAENRRVEFVVKRR